MRRDERRDCQLFDAAVMMEVVECVLKILVKAMKYILIDRKRLSRLEGSILGSGDIF
jgi:hypothetical protein